MQKTPGSQKLRKNRQVLLTVEEAIDAIKCSGNLNNCVLLDKEEERLYNNQNRVNNKFTFADEVEDDDNNFHLRNQQHWFTPSKYKNIDIKELLLSKCNTDKEIERVNEEYCLFVKHNMLDLIRYLLYLTDTLTKNDIVWGVGRGSSVSLYSLYLLDIHCVNSLEYELDYTEFFKEV